VYAVGLSLGGSLALHCAAHHPDLRGVVAMNPVLYLEDWRLPFLPILRRFRRCLPAIAGDLQDPAAVSDLSYDRTPLASIDQLVRFMRHLEDDLPEVRCPALIMSAARDHVVPPGNGRHVLARIGSREKRLAVFHRSSHVLTLDWEKERVFALARTFIRRYAGPPRSRLV
jgi:carboxylesterase